MTPYNMTSRPTSGPVLLTAIALVFVQTASFAQELKKGESQIVFEKPEKPPEIEFWYGEDQVFGLHGDTQPLINILGSVKPSHLVTDAFYQVNGGKRQQMRFGPDLHRLARAGDFNIELERTGVRKGTNTVVMTIFDHWGRKTVREMKFEFQPKARWELPFTIDFSEISRLQESVEVVDGKWELTQDGVRTAEPYYDRQFAFGDATWKDVELEAEIIFHHHFVDFEGRNIDGPPYLSHAHTSFNLRWAGHPEDNYDPRRNWMNLGSLVALRTDLGAQKKGSYWWMHYGLGVPGKKAKRSEMNQESRFSIKPGKRYKYRMRTETLENNDTRYSTKVWAPGGKEPEEWQFQGVDQSETVPSGSIMFVVHHSDVTLCNITVKKLD